MASQRSVNALPVSQTHSFSSSSNLRSLNIDNINQNIRKAQYAVRGELAVKSEQYRTQLARGEGKHLPFDTVISANIGERHGPAKSRFGLVLIWTCTRQPAAVGPKAHHLLQAGGESAGEPAPP